MVLRGLVGVSAGFLVGVGFALSVSGFREYCDVEPLPTACGGWSLLLLLLIFVCWTLVAGVLIHTGFRLARETRGWSAAAIGSVLWVGLFVVFLFVRPTDHVHQEHDRVFLLNAVAVVACVAYAIAALGTGRRRTA